MSNSLSTMQVVRGVIHPMNKFMGSLTDDLYRKGEIIMDLYDIEVVKLDGSKMSLREFEGQVLVIMNTASG